MTRSITGRIGLIGNPVEHSLSPVFQQAAFDALNIPVTYELWQTTAEEILERIAAIRSGEIYGVNVTVPHKEAFAAAVDRASDVARRAGAVNTLMLDDEGRLYGDNTDAYGFIQPLREQDFPFAESDALILGAGGASRGVVVALLDAGIRSITVANRTLARADAMASDLGDSRIATCVLTEAPSYAGGVRLAINATALGWNDEAPVDQDFFKRLPEDAIAYDLTYRQTPYIQAASDAGLQTIDGLPMLVHQGARSFELWTDLQPPVDLMMAAAIEARDSRN
ncbi:MAG: shikimate dehydrogenase [Thermomicrobiales bacterium]